MQNIRIIYKNLWRNSLSVTASSANPQFPAVYTQDDDKTLVWRTVAGALSSVTLSADLGESPNYDWLAILNHNFTAAATVTLAGTNNSDYSGLSTIWTPTYNATNVRALSESGLTYRYVRLTVTDAANPSNYIQIGTMMLGKAWNLASKGLADYSEGDIDYTVISESPSKNVFITQSRPSMTNRKYRFNNLTATAAGYVRALITEVGNHAAFEICDDYTAPNTNTHWVMLKSQSIPVFDGVYWSWEADVEDHV